MGLAPPILFAPYPPAGARLRTPVTARADPIRGRDRGGSDEGMVDLPNDQGAAPSPVLVASAEDLEVVARLRAGDEATFDRLVEHLAGPMLRLALLHVPSRAVAEEVVQEAWLGVLRGLDRFEGRSSLKTWILRILANIARRRGEREARSIPLSALVPEESAGSETSIDPERFLGPEHPVWPGHWAAAPRPWDGAVEDRLLEKETTAVIEDVIARLPAAQRAVITMRDVVGLGSSEVCSALQISAANQRVLLHRARARVRRALEAYLDSSTSVPRPAARGPRP